MKTLLVVLMLLAIVTPAFAGSYNEWISNCKSYKDVEKFFEDWNYHRTPIWKKSTQQEMFESKTGACNNVSVFAKDALNTINPNYKAEVVEILGVMHYVCAFHMNGKIYIMDFGRPYKDQCGVFGPFHSVDEYKSKQPDFQIHP